MADSDAPSPPPTSVRDGTVSDSTGSHPVATVSEAVVHDLIRQEVSAVMAAALCPAPPGATSSGACECLVLFL